MPIAAIIAHTRRRCWPSADASAVRRRQRNAYSCRYRREVYSKKHPQRSITLSLLQDQRLCAAAALHGRKPAAFLREAAFAYLEGRVLLPAGLEAALAAYTLEVRRIGTNINQLPHKANVRPADAAGGLRRAIVLLERLEGASTRCLPPPPIPPAHAR